MGKSAQTRPSNGCLLPFGSRYPTNTVTAGMPKYGSASTDLISDTHHLAAVESENHSPFYARITNHDLSLHFQVVCCLMVC